MEGHRHLLVIQWDYSLRMMLAKTNIAPWIQFPVRLFLLTFCVKCHKGSESVSTDLYRLLCLVICKQSFHEPFLIVMLRLIQRIKKESSYFLTWPVLFAAQWPREWAAGLHLHTVPPSSADRCSAHSACGERASGRLLCPKDLFHH